LIELFLLGVTAEALKSEYRLKIAFSLQMVQLGPKFQKGSPPSTILLVKKTRMNDLLCGIRMWHMLLSF